MALITSDCDHRSERAAPFPRVPFRPGPRLPILLHSVCAHTSRGRQDSGGCQHFDSAARNCHRSGAVPPSVIALGQHGFDPRLSKGVFYGRGTYFAENPEYSVQVRSQHRLCGGHRKHFDRWLRAIRRHTCLTSVHRFDFCLLVWVLCATVQPHCLQQPGGRGRTAGRAAAADAVGQSPVRRLGRVR